MRVFTYIMLAAATAGAGPAMAQSSVGGYVRKDGTYVQPHMRSSPDGIRENNWSYPGNTNPYTGQTAPGNIWQAPGPNTIQGGGYNGGYGQGPQRRY